MKVQKEESEANEDREEFKRIQWMKDKSSSSIFLARSRNKQFMIKTQSMFKDICKRAYFF